VSLVTAASFSESPASDVSSENELSSDGMEVGETSPLHSCNLTSSIIAIVSMRLAASLNGGLDTYEEPDIGEVSSGFSAAWAGLKASGLEVPVSSGDNMVEKCCRSSAIEGSAV
jgi:hypothetical protein